MVEAINRNQLLRGDLSGEAAPIRPPWSGPEGLFIEQCERCDDCIKFCEQNIIRRGSGGFPLIDFSKGHCTFCGDCVKACQHAALTFPENLEERPWALSIEIKDNCLSMNGIVCRICGERCEESAVRFQLQTGGRALPLPDPELCSGCGECSHVCPSFSIKIRPLQHARAA